MISSVEYKDSTFTLTLFYFLSSSHSIHSKIKWKTDSHIHIVFSPNNSTLLFILSKYFSFHSFPTTIHNIAKTQWKLFSISFSFTRFNAWFSSAALPAGVDSASPFHWWVLWVFWVVFSTLHPNSIMNTLRRFGAAVRLIFPLRAATLAGRFRLDAFTSNLCKSRRTTRNQSTTNPNGRRDRSRAWSHCDKSSLQSEYLWFSANRNTLRPICANFPFFASNWIS